MELINEYTKQVPPFESLMHHKGYTGKFELTAENSIRFRYHGTLKECLQQFLENMAKDSLKRSDFSLSTHAEYLSADDYKECHFSGSFDIARGFVIERLLIHSRFPDETQRLTLRNNQEVLGKNAVIGRFRKPKPRQGMMRSDFKHSRK